MNDLDSILNSVAQKKLKIDKAKSLIEKHYQLRQNQQSTMKESLKGLQEKKGNSLFQNIAQSFSPLQKFSKIKEGLSIDDVLNKLSHTFPQLEKKLQDQLSHFNVLLQVNGIEGKSTIYKDYVVSSDCKVSGNKASQLFWQHVKLDQAVEFHDNIFSSVQFMHLNVIMSDFTHSHFEWSKINQMTIEESKFDKNIFKKTALNDVSITEADFCENALSKTTFEEVVFNSCRIAMCEFNDSYFENCNFDKCVIENIQFEDCDFENCEFSEIHVQESKPITLRGKHVRGIKIEKCNSLEEFIRSLDSETSMDETLETQEGDMALTETEFANSGNETFQEGEDIPFSEAEEEHHSNKENNRNYPRKNHHKFKKNHNNHSKKQTFPNKFDTSN